MSLSDHILGALVITAARVIDRIAPLWSPCTSAAASARPAERPAEVSVQQPAPSAGSDFRGSPPPADIDPAGTPPLPAGSLRTLHGAPTFAALQDILTAYAVEHGKLEAVPSSPGPWCCRCGTELPEHPDGPFRALVDHCVELQASALSFAIQEARSTT